MDKNSIEQLRRMELHFSHGDKKYCYDKYGNNGNCYKISNYSYRNNGELKYRYKDIKSIFCFKLHTDEVYYSFPVRLTKRNYRWHKSYKQYIKLCSKYLYELAQKEGYNYKRNLIWTDNFMFVKLSFTFMKLPSSQTILNQLE